MSQYPSEVLRCHHSFRMRCGLLQILQYKEIRYCDRHFHTFAYIQTKLYIIVYKQMCHVSWRGTCEKTRPQIRTSQWHSDGFISFHIMILNKLMADSFSSKSLCKHVQKTTFGVKSRPGPVLMRRIFANSSCLIYLYNIFYIDLKIWISDIGIMGPK